eukprot:jgi/Mesvir1/27002/Mv20709-RA.1
MYGTGLSSRSQAERQFPQGVRLAIKEPFFKMRADGTPGIRVDDPDDIVIGGGDSGEDCSGAPAGGQERCPGQGSKEGSGGLPDTVASLRVEHPDWTAQQVWKRLKDTPAFQRTSFNAVQKLFQQQGRDGATAATPSATTVDHAERLLGRPEDTSATRDDPGGPRARSRASNPRHGASQGVSPGPGASREPPAAAGIIFETSATRDAAALRMADQGCAMSDAGRHADAARFFEAAIQHAYKAWLLADAADDRGRATMDGGRSSGGQPSTKGKKGSRRQVAGGGPGVAMVHAGGRAGKGKDQDTRADSERGPGNRGEPGGHHRGIPVHALYASMGNAMLQGGRPVQAFVYFEHALRGRRGDPVSQGVGAPAPSAPSSGRHQPRADLSGYYVLQIGTLWKMGLLQRASAFLDTAREVCAAPAPAAPHRDPPASGPVDGPTSGQTGLASGQAGSASGDAALAASSSGSWVQGQEFALSVLEAYHAAIQSELQSVVQLVVGPGRGQFRSISAALAAAPARAEILVHPGLYRETLVVTKSVTIRNMAADAYDPVADGGMSTTESTPLSSLASGTEGEGRLAPGVVCILATDSHTVFVAPSLVAVREGSGITVCLHGLQVYNMDSTDHMHALWAKDALVTAVSCDFFSERGPVVVAAGASGVLTLSGCCVHDGGQGGVLVHKGAYLAMDRSVVCRNAAAGMEFRQGGGGEIQGSFLFGNLQGIIHWHEAGPIFVRTTSVYSHKRESGISCTSKTAVVQECEVYGNLIGVNVEKGGELLLERCRVHDSMADGVLIQGTGSGVVKSCEILDNHSSGVLIGFDLLGEAHVINTHAHDNAVAGIFNGAKRQPQRVFLRGNQEHGNGARPLDPVSMGALAGVMNRNAGAHDRMNLERQSFARRLRKLGSRASGTGAQWTFDAMTDELLNEHIESALSCHACGAGEPPGKKFNLCARCRGVSATAVCRMRIKREITSCTQIQSLLELACEGKREWAGARLLKSSVSVVVPPLYLEWSSNFAEEQTLQLWMGTVHVDMNFEARRLADGDTIRRDPEDPYRWCDDEDMRNIRAGILNFKVNYQKLAAWEAKHGPYVWPPYIEYRDASGRWVKNVPLNVLAGVKGFVCTSTKLAKPGKGGCDGSQRARTLQNSLDSYKAAQERNKEQSAALARKVEEQEAVIEQLRRDLKAARRKSVQAGHVEEVMRSSQPTLTFTRPDVLDAYLRDSGRLKQLHEDAQMLEVTEEWDVILAIAMKLRLGISYDKYQQLRQMISCVWDAPTQSFLPRTTSAGAKYPTLPTKHVMAEEMKEMLEEMKIVQSEDGTVVTSGLRAALLQDLRANPKGLDRAKILYQILGDGAQMARGFKALSIGGRVMRHGGSGDEVAMHQSPNKLQELVMAKGRDDDYKVLEEVTARLVGELEEIRQEGGVFNGNVRRVLEAILGGDLQWLHAVLGLVGCSGTYPCPWCHMSKDQLHEGWLGQVEHELRTLEGMRKMAHAHGEYPYDCPACGECFTCEEDEKDSEPPNPTARAAFAKAHYGQFFGRPPIFNIPLTHVTLCLLHMELNMVATWLQRVVLDHVQAKDEERLVHMLKVEVECHVKPEQVKARKKTQGKGDLSERVTVIGRECHKVLNSGDKLLDVVFPEEHDMRPAMQDSLDALREFWVEVARPFEDDKVEGGPVRQAVADRVKAAAIKAADALARATAAENLTLYYHIAVDHLPAAILNAHPPVDAHDILSHEDHSSAPDVGNLPHGRSPKRRLWTILVVLIIIGVVSLFIWFYPAIVRHVFIPALDWSSRVFTRAQLALLLMALMTLLPLIWPFSAPVLWVTAMTFGWGWGALLLTLGTAGGMALPFLVARRWLAGTVQAWLATKRTVGALVAAAENQAPFWGILLLRLSPAPFMAINYAAGVTTIPFRVYMAASMLGEIPGHILALYTVRHVLFMEVLLYQGIY